MNIVHSYVVGSGSKNLLILHGFLGTGDNWKSLAKQWLGFGYKIHLLDQRNHGKSFWHNKFDYDTLAQDVINYINHHKIIRPSILGHSMGGKVAMTIACNQPELINKLIIVDIVPKTYKNSHKEILVGLSSLDFKEIKSREIADYKLSNYVPDKSTRQFLLKNIYWYDSNSLRLRLNISILKDVGNEIYKKPNLYNVFHGKSLFLFGEKSEYFNPGDEILIKKNFPESKLVVIKNAGHWLHAENPKDFSKEFLEWF
jgi:esterase